MSGGERERPRSGVTYGVPLPKPGTYPLPSDIRPGTYSPPQIRHLPNTPDLGPVQNSLLEDLLPSLPHCYWHLVVTTKTRTVCRHPNKMHSWFFFLFSCSFRGKWANTTIGWSLPFPFGIVHAVFGIFGQIICWHPLPSPPPEGWPSTSGNNGSTADFFTSMLGSQTGTQSSCGSRIPSEVKAPGGRASLASAPLDPPIDVHLKNSVSLTNHHQVNYTSVFVGFVTERWFHSITEWIWKIKISIFFGKE